MVVPGEPADPAGVPRPRAPQRRSFGHERNPMRVLAPGDEAVQDPDRVGLDLDPVDQVRPRQRVGQPVADEPQLFDGDVRDESLRIHRALDHPRRALQAEVSDLVGGRQLPQDRILGVVGSRWERLRAILGQHAVRHGEVPAHAPDLVVLMRTRRDAAHRERETCRFPQG